MNLFFANGITIYLGKIRINLSRAEVLIKTSIIFGLVHATLGQGWANVPIIAVMTLAGMAFGSLRLMTGNLWAPTVAHMINNACVFGTLHGIKLPSLTTSFVEILKYKKSLGLMVLA